MTIEEKFRGFEEYRIKGLDQNKRSAKRCNCGGIRYAAYIEAEFMSTIGWHTDPDYDEKKANMGQMNVWFCANCSKVHYRQVRRNARQMRLARIFESLK